MPFKVTMFFSDGKYGWSETYANNGTGYVKGSLLPPVTGPLGMLPVVLELAQARAGMLAGSNVRCSFGNAGIGSVPVLEYVRISTVGQPRQTAWYNPAGGDVVGGLLAAGNVYLKQSNALQSVAADNPYSAVEMLLALGNGLTSKRALSGVPDQMICDQSAAWDSAWYALFLKFAEILTDPQKRWGVLSSSPINNAGPIQNGQKIIGITQEQEFGRPIITTPAPLSFAIQPNGCPNYHVQISCYKSEPGGFPNLNGVYRVVVNPNSTLPPGTVITLARSFKPLSPFDNGIVAPYAGPTFTQIIGATATRPIMKKRGRPFALSRGRSQVIR